MLGTYPHKDSSVDSTWRKTESWNERFCQFFAFVSSFDFGIFSEMNEWRITKYSPTTTTLTPMSFNGDVDYDDEDEEGERRKVQQQKEDYHYLNVSWR